MIRATSLLPLLFFSSSLSFSQINIWQPTAPIEGGDISKIWADSAGNLYAGSQVDGLYRSTNGGAFWEHLANGFAGTRVTNFTVNHQGHIFVLTNYGMYRSTNNGESWTFAYLFFDAYSVLTTPSGKIFVGASQDFGVGRFYRSTDNGITWNIFDPPGLPVYLSLVMNNAGELFAGGTIGVYKSTNEGTSWDSVNTGMFGSRYVSALVTDPNNDMYAAVYNNGVFKTTNGGASWSQVGLAGISVWDLNIAPNGFFFAATESGVFRSTNSGLNWTPENNGLFNRNVECIGATNGANVYVGTFGSGVFQSTNFGESWQLATSGISQKTTNALAVHNDVVYAGVDVGGGLVRSTNSGTSWSRVGLQGTSIYELAIKQNGVMFVATYEGILKSTDSGSNWVNVGIQPINSDGTGFALSPTGFDFVWRDTVIYRSSNDGVTWTLLPYVFPRFLWKIVANPNNGFLFAVVSDQQVYRSINNGDTWQEMSSGITERFLRTIAVSPNGTVVVAKDSVFCSTNDGLTWQLCNAGLPQRAKISAIAFNSVGNIFLASYLPNIVYRTTNNGQSWENFASGLSGDYMHDMTVDSSDRLYLAAESVFRTINATTSVGSNLGSKPKSFLLHQNYPNPFNPSTNISYDLPKCSFVTLKVFNLIGQEVATLVNEVQESGFKSVKVEASALSSGVYLYRLVAGDFVQTRKMILMK